MGLPGKMTLTSPEATVDGETRTLPYRLASAHIVLEVGVADASAASDKNNAEILNCIVGVAKEEV